VFFSLDEAEVCFPGVRDFHLGYPLNAMCVFSIITTLELIQPAKAFGLSLP